MNQQSTFNVSDWLKHVRLFVCVVCLCCFVLFVVLFICVVYLCCLFVCVFCVVSLLLFLIVFADSYLPVSLKKKDIPHSSSALNFTDWLFLMKL